MKDVHTSVFSRKREFNPVMAAAFAAGLALQAAVTEVPYLTRMFGTASLSLQEWGVLLILAAFPVLAHEIFVLLGMLTEDTEKSGIIKGRGGNTKKVMIGGAAK